MTYAIVSGGFDPIHDGHIDNILEAASISDGVLIILNSNDWLKRKKGKAFQTFYTRQRILESIRNVKEVIAVDDEDGTVCEGLFYLRKKYPDDTLIFCKGGDRQENNTPEQNVCKNLNIEVKFHVGARLSGKEKTNSSSELLKNWASG